MQKFEIWLGRHKDVFINIIVALVILVSINFIIKIISSKNRFSKEDLNNPNIINVINNSKKENTVIKYDEEKEKEIINTFILNCKKGNINDAYKLLSKDCKEIMFPNIKIFKEDYVDFIFDKKELKITLKNIVNNRFGLKFSSNEENNVFYDYYTIIIENDEIKLNINNFLLKEDFIEKYVDYEIYNFKITNNYDTIVLMNPIENIESMYIEDENRNKYYAILNELTEEDLKIYVGETRKVRIKFNNKISTDKKIRNIVFSKAILDFDYFEKIKDKVNFTGYNEIEIMF